MKYKMLAATALACMLFACTTTTAPSNETEMEDDTMQPTTMMDWDRAAWLSYYQDNSVDSTTCDTEVPEEIASPEVFMMQNGHYVVQLLCSVHAYQNSYVFFNVMESPMQEVATQMSFDTFDEAANRTRTYTLLSPEYDAETQTLTSLSKARGTGDCGNTATYTWREDIGGYFDLATFAMKTDCDGELDEWPIIYQRAEEQPIKGEEENPEA